MMTGSLNSPPPPLISVIIPVFNQWRYTAACLDALRRTLSADGGVEVIVIDNASTDETTVALPEFQQRWSALRFERLATNTGFSPACNRGAELARGEYLVFLNNDTEVQDGWLPPLLAAVRQPGVGIAGPKLLYPETRTINHAGYVFCKGNFYGIYHTRPGDLPGANKPRIYQALLGACLIIRRDLFESLGMFSLEGLEDIDLCLKARDRGLASFYVPTSVVLHHGSVTLRQSPPGSFPETTVAGFGERWGGHLLFWDDFSWHIEDGEWPPPPQASDTKSARKLADESMGKLLASLERSAGGNEAEAQKLLEESCTIWPHNPWAFIRLCEVTEQRGSREDLLHLLRKLGEFSFFPGFARELRPILERTLGPEVCASIFSSDHPER